ncbi:hypothetical protein [Kutzneria albida]|nr:hypothetical protein [Kutzneria albida]
MEIGGGMDGALSPYDTLPFCGFHAGDADGQLEMCGAESIPDVVDTVLAAHGRGPFAGQRRSAVAMAEPSP